VARFGREETPCVASAKNSSLNPHRDSKLPRRVTGTQKPFVKHMFKKRTWDSVQKRMMRGGAPADVILHRQNFLNL
jgi:hypothetical protein